MVPIPHRRPTGALLALGRRILDGVLTSWAAVTITFFALRLAAGDPLAALLSQGLASREQAEALRHQLGLDLPLHVQYLRFLTALPQGSLGTSLYTGQPVVRIVAGQLPATAELATFGAGLAIAMGLFLGVSAAWWPRTAIGRAARGLAGLSTALPVALTGTLVVLTASQILRAAPGNPALIEAKRLALPGIVLGYALAGPIGRVVHTGLGQSLRAPYFLAARARGIRQAPRLLWHALRPVLAPAVSLSALEGAYLFAGTVVTETIFSRPGLGRLLVGAILQGDYPVAQGVIVLAALFYTASQVMADGLAILIDPRIKGDG